MSESDLEKLTQAGSKKKSNVGVFVIITLIFIAAITWLYIQNTKLADEKELKELALDKAYLQLDSISNELNDKILTISQLGGAIDTLMIIKTQLENDKKDLLNRELRQQRSIRDLADKVEGYQELLLMKDEEIKVLKQVNERLLTENSTLKVETQELNKSIQNINAEKSKLSQQIALVSRLSVDGITITAVSDRGKEKTDDLRNRNIKQLKIQFTVNENKVAPIEGKELLIRIIAPDGNTLFDVTRGSGTFMFEGREYFFTAKKEILYDRSKQQVTLFYEKGSDFAIGQHTLEVYTDEYLMGKGYFIVKA